MKEEVERVLGGGMLEDAPAEAPMQGFLGALARRGHYRRGERARPGWRNGYEAKRLQTEAGLLELAVPRLRATPEPFRPALVERLGTRTPDLEALVRGMYVRGLSTQDVSDLYGEAFGASRLSKSTVSRISQQLTREFDTWRKRDLGQLPVIYLFLDGQYHAARQGSDEKEGCFGPTPCWKMGNRFCYTWMWGRGNPTMPGSVSCRT
jgi:transposase-like protein